MSRLSSSGVADLERYLQTHANKTLLRFLTCGSVDDGKSTLIGRLLYESKMLYDDQLAALEADSKRLGTNGGDLDFALLLDGLAAEREQGITIDVAYRFFSTDKRKFIVADTPGHEQYTRNMVTGASTADVAVILIDARKGVLTQTRRHSYLVSLIGIDRVVLAINKLDLVGYSQGVFDRIEADYRAFADSIGLKDIVCIPLSATKGDNVTSPSVNTPWYRGPALMDYLETVAIDREADKSPLRMPVQWVNRPNLDFRGFSGRLVGGAVRVGERVRALPSGKESAVTRIVTQDGDLERAVAGQSVTITLRDEIDISRGDLLCSAESPASVADQFEATIVWMSEEEMLPGRPYLLKIGAKTVGATVAQPKYKVNVNSLEHVAAKTLHLNEIGVCNLNLDQAIAFDSYRENRDTGGLHSDRPVFQRNDRRGLVAFRAAPVAEHPLASHRDQQAGSRAADGSQAVHGLVHRSVRGRQIDGGQSGREETSRAGPAHVSARRRQRAARTEQGPGLHRSGSGREHPPRRGGGQAHGRCRPDRAGVVHFAIPGGTSHGTRAGGAGRVLRSVRGHARSVSPSSGIRRACTRRRGAANCPISPASIRPTSRRSIPKSEWTPPLRCRKTPPKWSSRTCARRACSM